jgi:hypothetical protein
VVLRCHSLEVELRARYALVLLYMVTSNDRCQQGNMPSLSTLFYALSYVLAAFSLEVLCHSEENYW